MERVERKECFVIHMGDKIHVVGNLMNDFRGTTFVGSIELLEMVMEHIFVCEVDHELSKEILALRDAFEIDLDANTLLIFTV